MVASVGMSGHERQGRGEVIWLTPPEMVKALGEFDLDPCFSPPRPWSTAKNHYGVDDNGLVKEWFGDVFCNPPYGKHTEAWMKKSAEHGEVIALIFARTETQAFQKEVWEKAHSILFLKGRINFYKPNGERGDAAGAPSCLVSYSERMTKRLKQSGYAGFLVTQKIKI